MKINMAILDDHPVVVDGIKKMFEGDETITVIRSWLNATSFLQDLEQGLKIDVLLLDILLPDQNGDLVARHLQKTHPDITILAISVLDSAISANTMLRLGASGYIMKHASAAEWKRAVLSVYHKEIYIEPSLKDKITNLGDWRTGKHR